jgi:hypothetical protein
MKARWSRVTVALLLVVSLAAAACSKPDKEEAESTGDATATTAAGDVGGETPVAGGAPAAAPAPTAQPGRTGRTATGGAPTPAAANTPGAPPPPGTPTTLLPVGDAAHALAIGKRVFPQSTQRRTPFYNGVTDKVIKLAFSLDEDSCGINALTALQAAAGTLPSNERFVRNYPTTHEQQIADHKESIENVVRYMNEHAFDVAQYLPNIRPLMGNDPKNQLFGRHFEHSIVDGGSWQCPEKTTAAAKESAETLKAFSVFNGLLDYYTAFNMASALSAIPSARRPMHFGSLWLSDQYYKRFAPFAWTPFVTGSTITKSWATYICSKLNGKKASRSPDPAIREKTRKFGLVYVNREEVKLLATELKGELQRYCGGNIIAREIQYSADIAAAQTDATNMVIQLKVQCECTSVIMLTDLLFPLFQMSEAERQGFRPEWIFSSFGLEDVDAIQRIYPDSETAGSFGISHFGIPGGFAYDAGDAFLLYNSYHQVSPRTGRKCDYTSNEGMNHDPQFCKAPANIEVWYYAMLAFYAGVLFSGPDLTPQNLSKGLQAYPQTRYGRRGPTADPRPALVGAGPGKYGFLVDAVEWRWRPDFKPPPPDEAQDGWVEYTDCQRHYILWPDQLAPQWEKGGPNYNAWCGNAKYAPAYSPAKDNYPRLK